MTNEELLAMADKAAKEIADEGHAGWGNLITILATRLRELIRDGERWNCHIRLLRKRHSQKDIDATIAAVDAAIERRKA